MIFEDVSLAIALLFVLVFLLLSILDMKYRTVPGIVVVFLGATLLALYNQPLATLIILLAVAWGWIHTWPAKAMLPLLLYPASWPVLVTGTGVREEMVGRGDLLAAGSLALVFPWPALVMSFISLEIWRRWWTSRRDDKYVPALPGMFIGICLYMIGASLWAMA